jgi:hypothetical protein
MRRGERDDVATDEEDSNSMYHFGVIEGTKKERMRLGLSLYKQFLFKVPVSLR